MPLEFRIKQTLPLPVDVTALSLDRLRGLETEQIRQIPVWRGNREVPCGELFEVSGSAEDHCLTWTGDCRRVKSIGTGLTAGQVRVNGDAGSWLGTGMRGGTICVSGNVGDWAGAEMRGGCLEIQGNAGDHAGGGQPGSKRGMTGGEILIHGNAGNQLGLRMRRGLIAVAGNVGAAAGAGMIAGTILIGGEAGPEAGAGMKRGTILLLKPDRPVPSSAGFPLAMTGAFTFVEIFLRHLRQKGFPLPEIASQTSYRLYRGDSLELGLGEILCLEHSASGRPDIA